MFSISTAAKRRIPAVARRCMLLSAWSFWGTYSAVCRLENPLLRLSNVSDQLLVAIKQEMMPSLCSKIVMAFSLQLFQSPSSIILKTSFSISALISA